jgi:biopolymer transport protein ExbD
MSLLTAPSEQMKRSLRNRVDAELNLIPLIDILSVMVAFLLVYSTNVEIVQNAKGVEIPQSNTDVQPKQSVVVMITKENLFVQGEVVATIDEVRDSKDRAIAPLLAVLERPMLVDSHAAAQDEWLATREITVLADKSLPYEVVKKVMATCTTASYGKISLAVLERDRPVDAASPTTA